MKNIDLKCRSGKCLIKYTLDSFSLLFQLVLNLKKWFESIIIEKSPTLMIIVSQNLWKLRFYYFVKKKFRLNKLP